MKLLVEFLSLLAISSTAFGKDRECVLTELHMQTGLAMVTLCESRNLMIVSYFDAPSEKSSCNLPEATLRKMPVELFKMKVLNGGAGWEITGEPSVSKRFWAPVKTWGIYNSGNPNNVSGLDTTLLTTTKNTVYCASEENGRFLDYKEKNHLLRSQIFN